MSSMQCRVGVEVLAVLAVVLLAPSVTEGVVLNKCELGKQLNLSLPASLLDINEVAKIVCHVQLTSDFNTSVIKNMIVTQDKVNKPGVHKSRGVRLDHIKPSKPPGTTSKFPGTTGQDKDHRVPPTRSTTRSPKTTESKKHRGARQARQHQEAPPTSGTHPTAHRPKTNETKTHTDGHKIEQHQEVRPSSGTHPTVHSPKTTDFKERRRARQARQHQEALPTSGTHPTDHRPKTTETKTHTGAHKIEQHQEVHPSSGTHPTAHSPKTTESKKHRAARQARQHQEAPPTSGTHPTDHRPKTTETKTHTDAHKIEQHQDVHPSSIKQDFHASESIHSSNASTLNQTSHHEAYDYDHKHDIPRPGSPFPKHVGETSDEKDENSEEKDHDGVWTLYGLFQLADRVACHSVNKTSLNLCNMSCNDLTNDDITDDIACVRTIIEQMRKMPTGGKDNSKNPFNELIWKMYVLLQEGNCPNVVDFQYFSGCK